MSPIKRLDRGLYDDRVPIVGNISNNLHLTARLLRITLKYQRGTVYDTRKLYCINFDKNSNFNKYNNQKSLKGLNIETGLKKFFLTNAHTLLVSSRESINKTLSKININNLKIVQKILIARKLKFSQYHKVNINEDKVLTPLHIEKLIQKAIEPIMKIFYEFKFNNNFDFS
jgi:hypothetical protein